MPLCLMIVVRAYGVLGGGQQQNLEAASLAVLGRHLDWCYLLHQLSLQSTTRQQYDYCQELLDGQVN